MNEVSDNFIGKINLSQSVTSPLTHAKKWQKVLNFCHFFDHQNRLLLEQACHRIHDGLVLKNCIEDTAELGLLSL